MERGEETLPLGDVRFGGDRELLARILEDDVLKRELSRTEVLRRRSVIRAQLLSRAVRVDVRHLPHVAESFARLARRVPVERPLEAFVFAEPGVNAFVAQGTRHLHVGISSGAVCGLTSEELDFVVGHELGHASFGHLDVPARLVLETGSLDIERCQLLLAWQRAAEVSADRAGLVCCGSTEVAANALFKTISGLPGLTVSPNALAEQWHHLVDELLDDGRRDQWQLSHPHPPLRMQALLTFWRVGVPATADAEVSRLLSIMAPPSLQPGSAEDPYVARFLFWGGAYVALANGAPTDEQARCLQKLAPPGVSVETALAAEWHSSEAALSRFQEAQRSRRAKISAGELHRIAAGLVDVAAFGGPITEHGLARLHRLGRELNLTSQAMDLMIAKQSRKG